MTGVSPNTMDDVTSGFNIGANVSLRPEFNEVLWFAEAEVRGVLETYGSCDALDRDVDEVLGVMREWYNGYRFAKRADRVIYNSDMVLYYLKHSIPNGRVIDRNVRIDYGKLRHLLTVNRQGADAPARLNGNFDLLRQILGEGWVDSDIESGFPLDRLNQRENFLSLLHYFGLLSIGDVREDVPRLTIPNQTVKRLVYGYQRDGYQDLGVFAVDLHAFNRLMHEKAFRGAWRPVVEFLSDAVAKQTGIRDYIDGERVLQGFLSAYLNATDYFVFHTERELGGGYADICLEPLEICYPDIRHGFVVDLKYLRRSEPASESRIARLIQDAASQLGRYLADDRLARQHPSVVYTGLAIVFHGWEMVHCDAVTVRPSAPSVDAHEG